MVAAGRKKSGGTAHALRDLEAENIAVESQGTLKVGNLKVDVTYTSVRMDRRRSLHGGS